MNFFSRLVGQNQAVELLTQAVAIDRIAPAYLFAGPNGVGRSLAARCFVELLFCGGASTSQQQKVQNRLKQGNHPDLLWVEPTYLHQGQRLSASEAAALGVKRKAPPQIRIEQIREITQFLGRSPLEASRSLVVIEQAESMAEAAANSLLKTLEEPGQATLILIAPSSELLLPTLVSRCQRIPFYRLTSKDMADILIQNGHEEIANDSSVLAIAQGSPGEAIDSWQQRQAIRSDLLDQLTSSPKTPRAALELARKIDKELDTEAQLWLVDYLQHSYWEHQRQSSFVQDLEKTRQYLLNYAQPRLVWECTLLNLANII
ncbi:MAG TPA: DNA polymerase III subunit delta' [Candidatus Obscuribacterales bacterium]